MKAMVEDDWHESGPSVGQVADRIRDVTLVGEALMYSTQNGYVRRGGSGGQRGRSFACTRIAEGRAKRDPVVYLRS